MERNQMLVSPLSVCLLIVALSTSTFIIGEDIRQFKKMDEAKDGRDALAKNIYERLFGWIVKQINSNLHQSHSG